LFCFWFYLRSFFHKHGYPVCMVDCDVYRSYYNNIWNWLFKSASIFFYWIHFSSFIYWSYWQLYWVIMDYINNKTFHFTSVSEALYFGGAITLPLICVLCIFIIVFSICLCCNKCSKKQRVEKQIYNKPNLTSCIPTKRKLIV